MGTAPTESHIHASVLVALQTYAQSCDVLAALFERREFLQVPQTLQFAGGTTTVAGPDQVVIAIS